MIDREKGGCRVSSLIRYRTGCEGSPAPSHSETPTFSLHGSMGGCHVTEIACVLAHVLPTSPQLRWLNYVACDVLGQGFLGYSILNKEGLAHLYLVPKRFTGHIHSSSNSLLLTRPKPRSIFPLLVVFSTRHGLMLSPVVPSAGYSGLSHQCPPGPQHCLFPAENKEQSCIKPYQRRTSEA